MGLLSFLKRNPESSAKAGAQAIDGGDSVQQARTRARQRLVGAVVLVAVGVIGFPLLFETQPRPLPVDTPIEIVRKEALASKQVAAKPQAKPAATPAAPPVQKAPAVIIERANEAGKEVVAASAPVAIASVLPPAASQTQVAAKPAASKPESKPKPEAKPATKPATKPPTESTRAQAALDNKEPSAKKAVAEEGGRFVVQIGAFSEASAARETRQKVDKLGFKSYTQKVDTANGKRIRVRVGPFESRDEADKVADKIKSVGLPSAVYSL